MTTTLNISTLSYFELKLLLLLMNLRVPMLCETLYRKHDVPFKILSCFPPETAVGEIDFPVLSLDLNKLLEINSEKLDILIDLLTPRNK